MLTLVTGATGLVGNNVVRLLLARGERVRVLQRASSDPRPMKGLDVEVALGDVRDAAAVMRACEGVDRVIHSAGHVHIGWTGEKLHRAINIDGTQHVIAGARAARARLVHISTVDAIGFGTRERPATEETRPERDVRFPYVITKRQAEQLVLDGVKEGLDAVIVNPVYMLGPWDWKPSSGRMILHIARGWAWFAPRGGNDFCDVRDVAAGIVAAAERGKTGRRYILGGEPLSYLEAWRMFAELAGVRGPICRAGPAMIWVAGQWGDLQRCVGLPEPDLNSAAAQMSRKFHYYSYERAATELGYAPRSAREAAVAAWTWFQDHGYCPARPVVA
jgi:dihydroflavonol-4-reductase